MTAILYSATIASLYFFAAILGTGFVLLTLLRKKYSNIGQSSEEAIVLSIGIGFLFNSLMFLIAVFAINHSLAAQSTIVIAKYTIDITLLIAASTIVKNNWHGIKEKILSLVTPPGNIGVFALAIAVGATSLVYFPHTLDSSQLLWTMKLISGLETSTYNSTGAFGYSSLLYYPFYFITELPLVTLAAGYKLAFTLLLALAVIYMINTLHFISPRFVKPAYFLIIISSFFGQIGLMEYSKDSILGVLFSMLYITSIIRLNKDETSYIIAAIFFSAAIISGVITIPYMLLFTGIYILINLQRINVFLFVYWLMLFSFIGLSVAINSMMKAPLLPILISTTLFVLALFALRNTTLRAPAIIYTSTLRHRHTAYITMLILILATSHLLMPVKVGIIVWADVLGNAVIDYRPPLDGEMSFSRFMLKFEPFLLKLITILGLAGFFILTRSKKWGSINALYALALFPISMVLLVLIISHLPITIFSGFNLWDMMRDIPLWYGALIYGLFALILTDHFASRIGKNHAKTELILLLVLSVPWGFHLHKVANSRYQQLPHYTESGGHRDKYFSRLTEFLFKTEIAANYIYISKTSKTNPHFYGFQMYSFITPQNINPGNKSQVEAMNNNLPAFFVGGLTDLMVLKSHKDITIDIKELQFFESSNESIFLLKESEEFSLEKYSGDYEIAYGEGFHGPEKHNGKDFRWVNKYAIIEIGSINSGLYRLNFDVKKAKVDNISSISIYINDKIETTVMLDSNSADYDHVEIELPLNAAITTVKLIANGKEVKFPNDSRDIAYGIIIPGQPLSIID